MATNLQTPVVDINSIDTSRYEQIDGQLVERPVPKVRHSEIQGNLIEMLGPKARNYGLRVYPELSIDQCDVPKSDWMTPDVAVTQPNFACTQRGNALPPLLLAIEVLSPSQTVPEMIRKADRYIAWGVEHVWLIEPEKQFAIVVSTSMLRNQPVLAWPGFDLRVGEAGLSIPLADLLA